MIHPNAHNSRTRAGRLAKTFALAFAAALALAAAPAGASAQAREMLNRLVQSQGQNDPASRAFSQGRGFIADSNWEQAAATFDRLVSQYPSDKNVDAALYWLPHARHKQGNIFAAAAHPQRLPPGYPRPHP